ncbi:MAG: membrane protein insertase YidC [Gammaproteobacteria bacterium]|nr:membrane protein insertase YidC [Gammaproteobacteria bacterium]
MESKRGFLFLAFAILSFLLYQAWQKDYAPKPEKAAQSEQVSLNSSSQVAENNLITVTTDLMKFKIDPVGGDLVYAETLDYNLHINDPSQKVVLFDYRDRVYQAKSALLGKGAPDNQLPRATYSVDQKVYNLADGQDEVIVPLRWQNAQGITFIKNFTFKRDHYLVDVEYQINNQSANDRTFNFIAELVRDQQDAGIEEKGALGMKPFLGVAYSPEAEVYEKVSFEDLAEEEVSVARQGGWVAFIQHYFVSAWIPQQDQNITISAKILENQNSKIQFLQPTISVPANSTQTIKASLFVGPKLLDQLESAAPGLNKTMDLSWVWWIGIPLYKLLNFFYGFLANWGLAIIMVTVTVKTILYPLSKKQYKSAHAMRKMQPKMQRLKERYGDDKQRMQQEMMKMYKEEGSNPFGGCLPMLLQFPIFIALYYVLFEAVELRHAPFFGWIQDLSVQDPYFVLPLLMGASMYLMQKMQPTSPTMDPMQQKMFQYLPVFFTVFMLFFPAGLVLYWLCNNLISIAQQQYVNKKIEKEEALGKNKTKKK